MILAISSVVSAAFGALRNRLLGGNFGAGESLDIYYAAFKIPILFISYLYHHLGLTTLYPFFLERGGGFQWTVDEKLLDETLSRFPVNDIFFNSRGLCFNSLSGRLDGADFPKVQKASLFFRQNFAVISVFSGVI